jgi:hypothetical protein
VANAISLPDVSDYEHGVLRLLLGQLEAKRFRNELRASYYDGRRAITQVGTVIPPIYYRLGIVLGWSAKAVDILARRCNCDGFVWPDGDLNSLGYREVFDGNNLDTEISSATISSLIHATSFLVNTEGDPDLDEPVGSIHVKDAMSATGLWNSRSRRLDAFLSITRRDTQGGVAGLVLYLYGRTIIGEFDGSQWFTEITEHPYGMPAEPLVYKPRVGRPFGSSRISRPVMSLHDQALRTVIRMEGHADIYSFPEMWMLGADEKIFKNADGTQRAVWQTMLGRIKGIPDAQDADGPLARADVKQFPASSPQPHIDQLKQQAQLFSGETSIPLTSLGVSDMSNPTSADSYIASREDLIAEAEGATDDWGPALRRSMVRALAMANGEKGVPKEWATIAPKWRSPVYLSRAAQADAGMKTLTAAPFLAETEVGLELLGLSEQQIQRALAEKRRNGGSAALRAIAAAASAGQPVVTSGNGRTDQGAQS